MPKTRVKMPVTMRMASRKRRGVGMNGVGRMRTRKVVKVLNIRLMMV